MVCPAETPEGHAVGLVKNLALLAYISKDSPSLPILEVLIITWVHPDCDTQTDLDWEVAWVQPRCDM